MMQIHLALASVGLYGRLSGVLRVQAASFGFLGMGHSVLAAACRLGFQSQVLAWWLSDALFWVS